MKEYRDCYDCIHYKPINNKSFCDIRDETNFPCKNFEEYNKARNMGTTEDRIKEGDIVNIFFESNSFLLDCKVLYVPQSPMDCWHVKDKDNLLHYVQKFESIHRKEES